MNSPAGKWIRSGSVPQETASWVDEYLFEISENKIHGKYRHYHEGPGPDLTGIITEEKGSGTIEGEILADKILITVEIISGYDEGKKFTYQVIPSINDLQLIFTREDGSVYKESLRKIS